MNFVTTIKLILELLPLVISVVKQLEEIFPEAGMGSVKYNLVVKTIQDATRTTGETLPIIEKMINSVVAVLNEFGVFNKKDQ